MQPVVISAMSRKGGAGKTTLVRAMASALAFNKKRVLLIDADPNRALATWAERAGKRGTSSPLLSINETIKMDELTGIVDETFEKESADFILIDTPGVGGGWADTIAMLSDLLVTPLILTRTDLERTMETVTWYDRLRERVSDPSQLPPHAVVITRFVVKSGKSVEPISLGQQELLSEVRSLMKPVPYPMRERLAYQDMDNEGLLGERAAQLKADDNPLIRGRARRYDDALHEAIVVTKAILSRMSAAPASTTKAGG